MGNAGVVIAGMKRILSTCAAAPGWEARRKRKVGFVESRSAPETSANDRVPRFSRRVLADSVRFVRFDMT